MAYSAHILRKIFTLASCPVCALTYRHSQCAATVQSDPFPAFAGCRSPEFPVIWIFWISQFSLEETPLEPLPNSRQSSLHLLCTARLELGRMWDPETCLFATSCPALPHSHKTHLHPGRPVDCNCFSLCDFPMISKPSKCSDVC